MASRVITRSNVKRLNKKAKIARIESELKEEKKLRASVEQQAGDWKDKALRFRRYSSS